MLIFKQSDWVKHFEQAIRLSKGIALSYAPECLLKIAPLVLFVQRICFVQDPSLIPVYMRKMLNKTKIYRG